MGAAGVVLGLVFVGFQIRQSATATRAETVLELRQSWVELNLSIASNPEMSAAIQAGYASQDPDSRFRLQAFHRALFYSMSNAYSQFLPERSTEKSGFPTFATPRSCRRVRMSGCSGRLGGISTTRASES